MAYLTCSFGCRVHDCPGAAWRLEIGNGRLTAICPLKGDEACCYVCDAATFKAIVTCMVSPQDAFFDLRVNIEGDVELGLKLSPVLETFFKRYPWDI